MAENEQSRQNSNASTNKVNNWNIFRKDVLEQDQESSSKATETIFKIVKLFAYIVLFLLVFGGSIITRASLQILTNEFQEEKKNTFHINLAKDAIAYYMLFILTIPDGVKLLLSFFKVIFGKRSRPSILQIIVMVIKECVHMFCLAVIVFKIMPTLNSIEVCAYLAGIPLVPSILHSVSYRKKCTKRFCKQILNILSILLQSASVFAVPIYKRIKDEIDIEQTIWMLVSARCVSVRWFETYFKYSKKSSVFRIIFGYERRIETHFFATMVTSLGRLGLMIILFPTFFTSDINKPEIAFSQKPDFVIDCIDIQTNQTNCINYADTWLVNPFLVHFFVCAALYYAAVLSTKICMDRVCFCIALSFSTPVYIGIILISQVNDNWISRTFIKDVESPNQYIMAVIFIIAWLSQLWICRHIWYGNQDRLMFENELFVLPHYCSPIADQSLLHSRRHSPKGRYSEKKEEKAVTKVYICATMWHENRQEMKQILKTLFSLDLDQAAREVAKQDITNSANQTFIRTSKAVDHKDFYEFEAHIMFDDAMETVDGKREPNEFVQQLIEVLPEAGTAVHRIPVNLKEPDKLITPYGGRIIWTLPGNNHLVVHLKDKDKIRHKKRWSQIMYMYYLLGYKLVGKNFKDPSSTDFEGADSIFKMLPKDVVEKANNTYVMALDGDVDFSPEALILLIDRMKKNPKVGATCGRIKPGGSGPVVWYQKFEYAVGHWLQKSAEHVFGCVLCSPGCFSLFRAKALMDDNIMRTYANLPTEPKHYLQYDQGEDRWLCTLMLQQGYRIEYCAAAEALTFAPEEFREFFNQRRRWMPSTMANILDLLQSYKRTTRNNSNISYLYIIYQIILFISSVLGPSTVLLAMQSAVRTVFGISAFWAYLLTYGPTVLFLFVCLRFKTQTQLTLAMILSAIYAMLMMAVIVGTIVNIAEEGVFTPTAVFMYILIGIFLLAGLFHPHEITDLFWGTLYFVCIPAGYLFLIIYAICNLNNVSWGTRETQKAVLEQQTHKTKRKKEKHEQEFAVVSEDIIDDILKQVKSSNMKEVSCRQLIPSIFQWVNNLIILRSLESVQNIFKNSDFKDDVESQDLRRTRKTRISFTPLKLSTSTGSVDEKAWAEDNGKIKHLKDEEISFWNDLIVEYLKPLDADKQKEKEIAQSLKEFRDKTAFAFFFVNALWLVIMSAMNEVKGVLDIKIPFTSIIVEPLGLIFLSVFAILLLLQFFGMVRHRYGTLLHLLAATNLRSSSNDPNAIIRKLKGLTSPDAETDFVIAENVAEDLSPVSPHEFDNIYENFSATLNARRNELGKTIRRPPALRENVPFDIKKTIRRNMKKHKNRQPNVIKKQMNTGVTSNL